MKYFHQEKILLDIKVIKKLKINLILNFINILSKKKEKKLKYHKKIWYHIKVNFLNYYIKNHVYKNL